MTKTLKIFSLAVALFVAMPAAQALAAPHAKSKAQFSQPAYGVAEHDGSVTLTVVRPQSGHSKARLAQGMTVDYSTVDGTAKAGTDYTAHSGTLTFPACGS